MTIKFSVALQGSYPIREYIDKAQRIDAYDFDEVHVNVREAAATGDFETGVSYISDLSAAKCSVTGTANDVIEQIEEMVDAGVTHVAFGHCLGPNFDEALDLLGKQLLPYFK